MRGQRARERRADDQLDVVARPQRVRGEARLCAPLLRQARVEEHRVDKVGRVPRDARQKVVHLGAPVAEEEHALAGERELGIGSAMMDEADADEHGCARYARRAPHLGSDDTLGARNCAQADEGRLL